MDLKDLLIVFHSCFKAVSQRLLAKQHFLSTIDSVHAAQARNQTAEIFEHLAAKLLTSKIS